MNRLVVRRELALRGYDVVRSVRRLRHAFANPEAAFLSAVHLLCAPAGRWDPDTSGPGRATFASTLYEELRDLWMRERAFDGGLLDVHTVLSMLGPHGYPGATWAEAVNPHLVGQLVCEYEASHQDLHVAHACAAHLARRFLDASRPDAPLHALTLEQYGYGQSRSFCWMVEHGTRDYVAISIGNASAHEVGRGAKRGAWCIRGSEGHTQEEAAQFFAQQVKPRLEEIAASACAFLDGRPTPPLTAAKLQTYRHLDAKTFCLLVSGRDEDAAHVRLVPVVSRVRLATLSRLLGAEPLEIHGFADYVEVQHRLGRALRRLPENVRPSADGLAKWSYDDPRGKVLCALLEGAAQREGAEEPADHTTSERALDDAIASTAAALPAPPADLPDAGLLGQLDDERRVDPVHTPLRPDLLHGGRELVEQVGAARPSTLLSTLNDPLLLLGCGPLSSSGGRGAPGWSVDKAAAFQRLVEQVLAREVRAAGLELRVQQRHGSITDGSGASYRFIRPDFEVVDGRRVLAIIDAKYKRYGHAKQDGSPCMRVTMEDIRQLSSYRSLLEPDAMLAIVTPADPNGAALGARWRKIDIAGSSPLVVIAIDLRALLTGQASIWDAVQEAARGGAPER